MLNRKIELEDKFNNFAFRRRNNWISDQQSQRCNPFKLSRNLERGINKGLPRSESIAQSL